MSQVIRYVHTEGKKIAAEEYFICFIQSSGKTSNYRTKIWQVPSRWSKTEELVWKRYDNTEVMAGLLIVIQKLMSYVNPKAEFVLCNIHSLYHTGVHAVSFETKSVTFFLSLRRKTFRTFLNPTHGLGVFKRHVHDSVAQEGVKRMQLYAE